MTRVAELFAAATMVLEDVHPVAVAGQRRDLAPDAARALVMRLRADGQMEGINSGAVVTGSAYTRLMAWFDRAAAPEKSGSFLPQYVSNVKSYAYMDFPLNQTDITPDLLSTGIYGSNVASDTWGNVAEEIDWCVLN